MLFADRCSGCHSLDAAGSQGTGNRGIRAQGPDLNQRKESFEDTLYAIENGGFSGAIMPQNIVVGEEAEAVAALRRRSTPGEDVEEAPTPGAVQRFSLGSRMTALPAGPTAGGPRCLT